jgi:hypothetical protein
LMVMEVGSGRRLYCCMWCYQSFEMIQSYAIRAEPLVMQCSCTIEVLLGLGVFLGKTLDLTGIS